MERPIVPADLAALIDQPQSPQGMGVPAKTGESDDTAYIAKLVSMFEDAVEASDKARKAAERDRDYYDHKQLTAKELAELEKRGQPDIIINRIQPKIDYLLGWESSSRTDPRAFPRTPQDEDAAEAATDALRYVEDSTDLDQKFSKAWEYMLIEGFGGVELVADEQTGDIDIKEWDWDRLFYDPHSRKPDFSDARYLGGIIWMDADEAKDQWPEAAEAIEITANENTSTRTYDDRPWQRWVTGKNRKRVRICQMYHKEGRQWKWCIFTKGGKIEGGDVPFLNAKHESFCPLMLQSAYVDRENNRYGLVRIMIGAQDEINKRRSKALHLLSVKNVIAERGAVDDVDLARAEMAKPDGWVEKNPGFELEVRDELSNMTGHLNLLQEAKNEIELFGPNAAMLGKQNGGDPSGRAILANQQGGQTELSRLLDRHRFLKKRVYTGIWDLVRQYKTAEWWVRVTDDEKNVKFVGMNRPVTVLDELKKRMESQGMPPDQIEQAVANLQADPAQSQELQQTVRMENVPAEMNMDIILEEVPDVANVAMEQFDALTKLAPAVTFPAKVYLQASSLRNKRELIEMLETEGKNPQIEQMQLETAMIELEKLKAEVEKIKADTANALVDADLKAAPLNSIQLPMVNDAGQPPQQIPQKIPPQQPPQPMPNGQALNGQQPNQFPPPAGF